MAEKSFWAKYKILIIVLALVAILLIWVVAMYNNFVGLDQNVNSKWSEVENQYQRQADLIGNIVSVVSSSVGVETQFVKDVTALRTNWENSKSDQSGVDMANGAITFVNAVAENYPQLQANKQYVALTDELSGTQNRIAVARGRYIETIQAYNTAIKRFPGNIFAGIFGFSAKEYYQADINAMNTPVLGTGVLP